MIRTISTFFILVGIATAAHAGAADKKLDIFWIDVEGGAATLFVTPAGESILIDTGSPGVNGVSRDATRIHKLATEVAKLKKIDFLITTHYHTDHFGGAAELSAMMPIGSVYDNGEFPGGRERPHPEYLTFECDKRVVINPGDSLPIKNVEDAAASPQISFTCIAARKLTMTPPKDAKPNPVENPRRKPDDFTDNANSIATLVRFGDWAMFVGGDMTWNIEQTLVTPINLLGQVDLYQSTHHGLDTSNNPLVVKACQPTVVVVNNGTTKGCMPEMFKTITTTDSIVGIYQMHRNLRPNEEKNNVPDEFIANQAKECDGNYIRCAVSTDAKSFVVSVPATKHEQEFKTK